MKLLFYFFIIFNSINLSAQQLKPLKPILENALNVNDNSKDIQPFPSLFKEQTLDPFNPDENNIAINMFITIY